MTPESPSIVPVPHRIGGVGGIRLSGSGAARLRVDGGAEVVVVVNPAVAYVWSGAAGVRVPWPDHRVFCAAEGALEVHGDGFALEVRRGRAEVELLGAFDVVLDARAHLVASDGTRVAGTAAGRRVRIVGPRVTVDAPPVRRTAA